MLDLEVRRYGVAELQSGRIEPSVIVKAHDLFFHQPRTANRLKPALDEAGKSQSCFVYPTIFFTGFHPDLVDSRDGEIPFGPLGAHHSAIVVAAFLQRLSVKQTLTLFSEKVFRHLGYFDHWREAKTLLLDYAARAGMPLDREFETWSQDVFVHVPSHPKPFVLADLARRLAIAAGFEPKPAPAMNDSLEVIGAFPVYPELAAALGLEGSHIFRTKRRRGQAPSTKVVFDLVEFVEGSFEAYAQAAERPKLERMSDPRYQSLASFVRPVAGRRTAPGGASPYANLPDYRFWRRAVAGLPAGDVDPVTRTKFKIGPSTKIATAGSCFAQHIARTLMTSGHNFLVTEDGTGPNYGVFSARFGNIYTARQLLQLFDRAYGDFVPADKAWVRTDGRFIDPFRPEIEPDGFANADEVALSRKAHLAAVRRMFEELDVLIFTLGLTEAWQAKADGAVFPIAPGVVAASQPSDCQFVNFGIADVTVDLWAFLKRLRSVNPNARVIFTVSPVPLMATYEDRHVMVATSYSKSVLRVAADECARTHDWVDYFPSYEIVTGPYSRGAYFADDVRSVTDDGVAHVMRLFLKHYAGVEEERPASRAEREFLVGSSLVCEEELLDER